MRETFNLGGKLHYFDDIESAHAAIVVKHPGALREGSDRSIRRCTNASEPAIVAEAWARNRKGWSARIRK